ncbi:competence/damage-inducible protein A [Alkalibacterium sp. f15]|uniref:competence/damage-inducible protein A n=1 Tax=Alkalibacterium sp. f15 TaxID=3414029 RepID=UPI003BF8BB90
MRAVIISIGTELLSGQVVNTNAAFISRELVALGIDVFYHETVGDNPDHLKEAIKNAEERVGLIIISGGLGSMEDDITKQTLVNHLARDLRLVEEIGKNNITYQKSSYFEMSENNQLPTSITVESIPLENDAGLVVGMILNHNDHQYVLLPGQPDVLRFVVKKHLKDELIKLVLTEQILVSRVLRFFGITQAQVTEKIESIVKAVTNMTVAINTDEGDITVRLTAKGETEEDGNEAINKIEAQITARLSDYFFGYGKKRLNEVVRDLLLEKELTITAAESLTGGAFISSLSSDSSAGSVFEGGIVTYSSDKKNKILKVTEETINKFGVVSPECAIEMAEKSRKMFNADIGVGLTGVAGPSSIENQSPGTVWIGLSYKGEKSFAKHFHFKYKRNENRRSAVLNAHELVRRMLLDKPIDNRVYFQENS